MTILITGITGILGSELKKILPHSICPTHKNLDICDIDAVKKLFSNQKIDTVIHTAALTSVRTCEENRNSAMKINVEGTKNLVEEFKNSNPKGKFVYISTACVFAGNSGMYNENSIPYPKNFYSLTKLLGENIVNRFTDSLIIRTNFVGRKKWPYPKAFSDRFGTYLFSDQVAKEIKKVLEKNLEGIVHIAGDKKISMFELAKITTPNIQSMTIEEYTGPKLTMNMSLDSEILEKSVLEI